MKGISLAFPGVKALSNVDFRLFPGEVHALMGQNGAGKSTLIKALTGVYRLGAGTVELAGEPIAPGSPLEAQRMGISTVYQEVNLCPNLTVAENIYIGRQPMRFGRIHWKRMNADAQAALAKLNIHIDVTQPLASYSVAVQQMVAIARALDESGAKILILDEPTSSLDPDEVQQLFKVIRQLRSEGLAVLFITHFLDQMYDISDRITILRNGVFEGEYLKKDLPKMELVARMLGKELSEFAATTAADAGTSVPRAADADDAVLSVRDLGLKGSIQPFSLDIRAGDILGLAGLLGSGRTEMARLIFGIDPADQGEVKVRGKKAKIHSPKQAMASGLAFCSEDRKEEGILAELTVRENIILALQGQRGLLRYLPAKKQEEIADAFIRQLKIKTPNSATEVKRLSGGNQQKVLLARALATDPTLLLLDEPTRGIDVGAKREIMELILRLSREGKSILFISSEFEEVLRCSNRIAVLKDKAKVAELTGTDMNEGTIMRTIAEGQ
jgi:simple sugar transport system ATP-binding protein